MSEFNETDFLLILNEEEATRRIPVMIYLGIILILGVIGNSTVIVVYTCYFQSSNRRTFVLCLATLDLTACGLCVPFEIADMRLPYMFYQTPACKFFRFFQPFTSVGSALVLLVIAIERYLKVCRSLRRQMSLFQAKLFCGMAIALAVFCSWPTSVFHGQKKIYLGNNITGLDCSRDDIYKNSVYKLSYDVALAVMFVVGIFLLITLYFQMGRTIYRQEQFRRSNANVGCRVSFKSDTRIQKAARVNSPLREDCSDHRLSESVPGNYRDEQEHLHRKRKIFRKSDCFLPNESKESENRFFTENRSSNRSNCQKENSKSQHSHKDRRNWKITQTMFIITLVYILSFLPHLALLLVKLLKSEVMSQPGLLSSVVFPITSRSIFINSVANPIIYGFWDAVFRKKLFRVFSKK